MSGQVSAEVTPPSTPHNAVCENAQTTAAMRACETHRYEQAEQQLEAAYRALLAPLDKQGQAKLRQAQEAWRRFRAAEADFQADTARGGTLAPLIRMSVLADMTEARLEQLTKPAQNINP